MTRVGPSAMKRHARLVTYDARAMGPATLLMCAATCGVFVAAAAVLFYGPPLHQDVLAVGLEVALPLAFVLPLLRSLTGDPATELRQALPSGYRSGVVRRFGLGFACLSVPATLCLLVLTVLGRWGLAGGVAAGTMIWLAPCMLFSSLGLLLLLTLRSYSTTAGIIVSIVLLGIALPGRLLRSHTILALLYPFATNLSLPAGGPAAPGWLANRVVVIGAAALLFAAAWLVAGRIDLPLMEGEEI